MVPFAVAEAEFVRIEDGEAVVEADRVEVGLLVRVVT